MQRNGGVVASQMHQACASCKHQRKKCGDGCELAPYFPPERSQQFQVVHKLFGVSNLTKMLKKIGSHDDKSRAVDSMVWEAECRLRDPISGCYGEFMRLREENNMLRRWNSQCVVCSNKQNVWHGWNNNNSTITNNNNMRVVAPADTINYVHSNGNLMLEHANFPQCIQGHEKGWQGRNPNVVYPMNTVNGFN